VIEGEIVEPPLSVDWRDKVAGITEPDDADAVISEATQLLGDEVMTPEHFARVSNAVETRLAELGQVAA
jgi:hypothetical protein